MNGSTSKLLTLSFLFLLLAGLSAGQTAGEVEKSLNNSRQLIDEMNSSDIPVKKAGDLYSQAEKSYEAQIALNRTGGEPDFSEVIEYTRRIERIHENAVRVRDELKVLESEIETLEKERNLSLEGVKKQFRKAQEEYENQRFEKSQEHIDQTYSEISDAKSTVTQAKAFYQATQQDLQTYVRNNIKKLSAALLAFLMLSYIGYREFKIYQLKKRKNYLEQRRTALQNLIEETQRKYFEEGKLSKSVFDTRNDTYSKMVRKVDQELPIVKQKLEEKTGLKGLIK